MAIGARADKGGNWLIEEELADNNNIDIVNS